MTDPDGRLVGIVAKTLALAAAQPLLEAAEYYDTQIAQLRTRTADDDLDEATVAAVVWQKAAKYARRRAAEMLRVEGYTNREIDALLTGVPS